jgi:SAM-dependent methyltransferase
MANNYDPIARYYDFLSRLFYGRAEIDAQVDMLRYVKPGDRALIVGGGTGWILEEISAMHTSGLRITYVESSAGMIALAKKRDCGQNEVLFVEAPVEEFFAEGVNDVEARSEAADRYDFIQTGFFFDNFSTEQTRRMVGWLTPLLKEGGYWLFADFYYGGKEKGNWWQAILLRSMYFSARLICGVEANELPDIEPVFEELGYAKTFAAFYYRGFIQAIAYRKGWE